MKLQAQYGRITITSSIIVLLIAGMGYYFLLHYVLLEQLDEALRVEEVEIADFINKRGVLPEATIFQDQRISFSRASHTFEPQFRTVKIYNKAENEDELCRQLIFPVSVNGALYVASVTKSQEATEKLISIILLVTLSLIVLLYIFLFFANRFLLNRLWKPFRTILFSIKGFDLNAPAHIQLPQTSIDEFVELNESVKEMAEKVTRDYQSLKSFTDHASHEMQTPLAIINSKLDVLIQDPAISERNMQLVQSIYEAVEKLSKLSQSLLLLTRIENNQFSEISSINLKTLINAKINELEDWIGKRNLSVLNKMEDLNVSMHQDLAEILVNNLLVNAVKHSKGGASISIDSKQKTLAISNSGTLPLDAEAIYNRFSKSDESDGTGLGLAIVKQICDQYGFNIVYDYKESRHFFILEFHTAGQ